MGQPPETRAEVARCYHRRTTLLSPGYAPADLEEDLLLGAREVGRRGEWRGGVLEAGAGEDQHDLEVAADLAGFLHQEERGDERRRFGRGPDPFRARDQPLRLLDRLLADRQRAATRVAQQAKHLASGER